MYVNGFDYGDTVVSLRLRAVAGWFHLKCNVLLKKVGLIDYSVVLSSNRLLQFYPFTGKIN